MEARRRLILREDSLVSDANRRVEGNDAELVVFVAANDIIPDRPQDIAGRIDPSQTDDSS